MKNQNSFSFSKILFIFSLLSIIFSTQINFSYGQARDLTCYNYANKTVDIKGIKIQENDLPRCIQPMTTWPGASIVQPIAYDCFVKIGPNGLRTTVDVRNVNNIIPEAQCKTVRYETVISAEDAKMEALAAEERRKSNLDPCTGVGSVKVAGVDRVGCEIWLYFTKFILQVSAELANLSAKLFDFTTQRFILQISTLFKNEVGADEKYIYGGWSVIRDLANIAAFFGAVYTGFRYITGSDSLDFKKAVTKLILYSILVNFSFPIAKFLIDISNVISLQIYGGITEYTAGANKLSDKILASMNLNSLISDVGTAQPRLPFTSFTIYWLAIIYLLAAFAAFLYSSLMILVRSFILLACVILSPLMFLNFAFPKLTELHEKWRENFFGQLIFAPVLMFGFWLSFILLEAAGLSSTGIASVGLGVNSYSSLVSMLLAIVALFMTVKIAGSVSGGAGKSMSGMVGGGMKGLGLAVATGGAGLAFRGTVGRAGAAMANSQWVAKNKGSENGATRRLTASLLGGAGTKMSNFKLAGTKSFDEKKVGNVAADKAKMKEENSQQIRKTGMSDLIAQAKNPEELKLAKEEMDKISSDPNYKRNNDLFGRNAKQKAFELSQSDIKSAKNNNVTFLNQGEYKSELVNKRRLESGAVSKLRDERLKKRDDGRQENFNKAEKAYDKNKADPKAFENMEKAYNKSVNSTEKTFDTGIEREEKIVPGLINKSENKIESLKNTTVLDALRGKKAFTGQAPAIGSKLTEPIKAVEPKQTVATNAVTGASSRG